MTSSFVISYTEKLDNKKSVKITTSVIFLNDLVKNQRLPYWLSSQSRDSPCEQADRQTDRLT